MFKKISIYMDNASFHKAKIIKNYARESGIELIFSPVYRPEFQPSEFLIGHIK